MPLMATMAYAHGVNAVSLVLLRNLLAMPILFLIMKLRRVKIAIDAKRLARVAWLGLLGSFFTPLLLFSSYSLISSGTATTLHFVYPAFVFTGCALFFKERVTPKQLVCVIACCAGIALLQPSGGEDGSQLLGVILAAVSGVVYAAYIMLLGKSGLQDMDVFQMSFYVTVFCSVAAFLFSTVTGTLSLPQTGSGWLWCIMVAIGVMIGAVTLFQKGTLLVGAQQASVLSTFEPITGVLIGIFVLNEQHSPKILVGVVLVLASSLALTLLSHKKNAVAAS